MMYIYIYAMCSCVCSDPCDCSLSKTLLFSIFSLGKARLFEFINALSDQPVSGSAARAVHSSGGAAGGVVSESQGEVVWAWDGMWLRGMLGSFVWGA